MVRTEIGCQKEKGLTVITINAAPRDESGLSNLIDALTEASGDIAVDAGMNVVVITGGQDIFDIGAIQSFPLAGNEGGVRCHSLAASLAGLDCPIIAATQGRVTGQGLELVLACDIRFAAEDSSFCMTQLNAGFIPRGGGTQRLPRIVGRAKALEMILTGQLIDGKEAERIGLVNRLVAPHELMTVTMDIAHKMASQAPLSLRYAKEAIYQGMEMSLYQALRLEADLYFLLHTTGDRREGIKAFQEKRKADFTGQ